MTTQINALRAALRPQHEGQFALTRCAEDCEARLKALARSRGVKAGVTVTWGNWDTSGDDELELPQFLVVLDLTKHVPAIIRPQHNRVQLTHFIYGNEATIEGMVDKCFEWGAAIIKRVAGCSALCGPGDATEGPLGRWMEENLQHRWNNDEALDHDDKRFHPFFSTDRDYYHIGNVHCLKLDDEADRALFRLRWF